MDSLYKFGLLGLLGLAAGGVFSQTTPVKAPPNVILIITDDQGWGDISFNGNHNLNTPFMDQLALQGARFEHFYVQPVCSPTRAEILTGKNYPSLGVYSTSAGGERMDPKAYSLGVHFRHAGYRTGYFGKWHNGSQAPYHPLDRGFQEFYGFTSGHWGHYFGPELEHNGNWVKGTGFLADDFTGRAIAYMESVREAPFLVVLAYNTPHSPMQVPDTYWKRWRRKELLQQHRQPDAEDTDFTRAALAMVENIDDNLGRLHRFLTQSRLQENTIVVFLSDNGPNGYRWNGGLKGRKGSTDEGGVKSPLFVRWPGTIRPGTAIRRLAGSIDLLPTLSGLTGTRLPDSVRLDGQDLSEHLVLGKRDQRKSPLYHRWGERTSVRIEGYRLDAEGRLYDLENDPGQTQDVSALFPALTKQLTDARDTWENQVPARTEQPFTVGCSSRSTELPARDGKAHGPVTRSNRYPNSSYFTNWNRITGAVSWEVDICETGRYEVQLYYTCAETDIGVSLELQSGSDSVTRQIAAAHDPEPYGAAQDRYPRIESYVKDFKAVSLGYLQLQQGRDTLWLRATKLTGQRAVDVRRLVLKKVR